jgi:hypothetical protein
VVVHQEDGKFAGIILPEKGCYRLTYRFGFIAGWDDRDYGWVATGSDVLGCVIVKPAQAPESAAGEE